MPLAAVVLVALRLAGPAAAEVEVPATAGVTAPVQSDPFALQWFAPPECPQHDAMRAAIEARLGRAIAHPLGDGVMVEARANKDDDGRFTVVLDLRRPEDAAHRELDGASDCAGAVEAAALVIAIAIDPELQLRVPEPGPEPDSEPAPEPVPVQPTQATDDERPGGAEPARLQPVRRRVPARVAIGAGAAASVGDLPTLGGHGRVYVALVKPNWRVELGGGVGGSPPLRSGDQRVDLWRWNVSPRGCLTFAPRSWLEVLPCTGLDVGETRVRVRPAITNTRDSNLWVAAAIGAAVIFVPTRRFGVRLGLDLVAPLRRHSYAFSPGASLHRTSPVVGSASLAFELRLP